MLRRAVAVLVLFAGVLCAELVGQSVPPSGVVTVRLMRAVESATMRAGQALPGVVVRSSNGSVPVNAGAAVQLVADPAGGFTLQLVRVGVNGQMYATGSVSAILADGTDVHGPALSLPANTLVSFVMGQAVARGPARVPGQGTGQVAGRAVAPRHPANTVRDVPAAAPGYPPMHASVDAQEGCWWVPFASERFGFEAAVQRCESKSNDPVIAEAEGGITLQFPGNESLNKPELFLEVHTKPAEQPLEAAIKQQFLMKLKGPAAMSCKAVAGMGYTAAERQGTATSKENPAIQVYTVAAFGPYAKLKRFNTGDDTAELPCPAMGDDAVARFFQYNPSESKTKFFFFQQEDYGNVFNDDSVHFLKTP